MQGVYINFNACFLDCNTITIGQLILFDCSMHAGASGLISCWQMQETTACSVMFSL